jgi:hypothetical protein
MLKGTPVALAAFAALTLAWLALVYLSMLLVLGLRSARGGQSAPQP